MAKMKQQTENLLDTLGDFTSKANWDDFFRIRGDVPFDWYAEWPELEVPLISNLSSSSTDSSDVNLQILVPGCGNSLLSEFLYDAGFHCITNIDFSKVAISNMLRRNVRSRPDMLWRIMDMTSMKFMDATFDTVIDKGGLDALMEPEHGTKLGNQYLSEVKRVLKSGGRFICLTLAESHVLGSLFSKFRLGWKTTLHAIPLKSHDKPNLQTFMVIIEKEMTATLHQIASSFNQSSLHCNESQARGLYEALDNENRFRSEYFNGSDIIHSLEDLQLGVEGDLMKLNGGRRFQLTLGEQGGSSFRYRAVVLDSPQRDVQFMYYCGIFLVPKTRVDEWLFSSEEGQWLIVESSKAARLIMVLLDSSHSNVSMDDIQKDLSPLVKQLAPENDDDGAQIPFMIAGDGIKHRKVLHQVTSALTGPIIIEDVVYEKDDLEETGLLDSQILSFRRLTFNRGEGLVQSEALLTREISSQKAVSQTARKKSGSSKSKKKEIQRQNDETSDQYKVYHDYLASSYHTGIISGFVLILALLENAPTTRIRIKTVIVGLGAGLLPMFLHGCMDFLRIEVVELDPMVFNLAKDYFGFRKDSRMKVHIADGIQFVRQVTNSEQGDEVSLIHEDDKRCKIDILIIDVDSSDSSSGLRCPASDFVEPSFLLTVKDSLAQQGLFVINLVSRSSTIKDMIIARMKEVFSHLYSLQLEEDVNEVLFALQTEECIDDDRLPEAAVKLVKLLKLKQPVISESIINFANKLKRLK